MESLQSLMAGEGGTNLLIIAIAGTIGMLVVVIGMLALDGSDRRKTNRRVQRVKNAGKSNRVSADAVNIKRSTAFSSNKVLDEMIRRLLPQPENLRTKLTRTGLSITPGKYLAANLVVAILAFFGFQTMPFIPTAGVVLLAIFVGAGLPYLTITFLANRRRNKFIANFPEAIDLMVRGLKSGLPITETLKVLGEEMEDPISTEFQAVTDAIKFYEFKEVETFEGFSKKFAKELKALNGKEWRKSSFYSKNLSGNERTRFIYLFIQSGILPLKGRLRLAKFHLQRFLFFKGLVYPIS